MIALVSNLVVYLLFPALTVFLRSIPEFLVTELALASHSITSLTLSSPSLLSPVLESHRPSAIIVHASLLLHTLELIYELNEFGNQLVIVVGEVDENVISKASQHVKLARWADLEARGKGEGLLITSPLPGEYHPLQRD
jgi:long-chain acyl-CoA synthetase